MKVIVDLDKYLGVETLVEYSKSDNIKQVLGFCPVYNILLCRMNTALNDYHAEQYAAALEEYNKRDTPAIYIKPDLWGDVFGFFASIMKWILLAALAAAVIYLGILFTPLLISFANGVASTHSANVKVKNAKKLAKATMYDVNADIMREVGPALSKTHSKNLNDSYSQVIIATNKDILGDFYIESSNSRTHQMSGRIEGDSNNIDIAYRGDDGVYHLEKDSTYNGIASATQNSLESSASIYPTNDYIV